VLFGSKPLSSIKIKLEGSKLTSIWTDANGYYTFSDLRAGGSFTVNPVASMNFRPSSRIFDDLRRDESADFFAQNDATPTPTPTPSPTPTPTPTPSPKPECSETDQSRALNTLRGFEPSWRRQIQDERARIIKENVPNNIDNAEASLGPVEFQYSFPKPCSWAVVTVTYMWRVSWPAVPGAPAKSKTVLMQRKYGCGKTFGMWGCTLVFR
jgi:hypothetical protein